MADDKNAQLSDQTHPASELRFDTGFTAQPGNVVDLAPGVARVVAPNAGPYTFTGTNTYLIGTERVFVLDAGPQNEAHLTAVERAIAGRPVEAILLTHTHRDHSDLARQMGKLFNSPIWFGGKHRLSRPLHWLEINVLAGSCDWQLEPDRVLADGDRIAAGETRLQVIETPGHCANHLSFGLEGTDYLFSGDHVMGWNSTLVATPDGDMGAYFASLDKLIDAPWGTYLPGHGGPIIGAHRFATALKAHREMRNGQIEKAVAEGARKIGAIVDKLYPGVPPATRRAAKMTVLAHAEYLGAAGRLRLDWQWGRVRVRPA